MTVDTTTVMTGVVGVLVLLGAAWGLLSFLAQRRNAAATSYVNMRLASLADPLSAELLVAVLTDLETDFEIVARFAEFEGDLGERVYNGWKQSRGGFDALASVMARMDLSVLTLAGLTDKAMEAKAAAYYYWRARSGLAAAGDGARQHGDTIDSKRNEGVGLTLKDCGSVFVSDAGKALDFGNIIAGSAIAVLDHPAAQAACAAADVTMGGGATAGSAGVKLAAHGASELKAVAEKLKMRKPRKKGRVPGQYP